MASAGFEPQMSDQKRITLSIGPRGRLTAVSDK